MTKLRICRQKYESEWYSVGTLLSIASPCVSTVRTNSSVVRPSVSQLSLYPMGVFFQILVVASPWPIRSDVFEFLKETKNIKTFSIM